MLKLEKHCRERGFNPNGIITQEVRRNGERIGFKLRDLSSGLEGWLARKDSEGGPKIGKYSVITRDLEEIGVKALESSASDERRIVLIDEIGPMEMTNSNFRQAISKLLTSENIVIATVKYGSHYEEVDRLSGQEGVTKIVLTQESREVAFQEIVLKIDDWLNPKVKM